MCKCIFTSCDNPAFRRIDMIMLLLEHLPLKSYEAVIVNLFKGQQESFIKSTLLHRLFPNKMGNLYDDLKAALETVYKDDVKVDNLVYKFHRSFTVLFCIIFATILLISEVSFKHNYEDF